MANIVFSIGIDKESILTDVRLTIAYAGLKDKIDGSTFEHISATASQNEAFYRAYEEVTNAFVEVVMPYLTGRVVQNNLTTFSFSFPSNWCNDQSLLETLARSMMVNYIVSKWMRIVKDADTSVVSEGKWASDFAAALSQLKRLVYTRVRPTRPTYEEEEEEDNTDDEL